MSIRPLIENARQDMTFVCQELSSAHSEACTENQFLGILLLDALKQGRELENHLKRIEEAMKEKK